MSLIYILLYVCCNDKCLCFIFCVAVKLFFTVFSFFYSRFCHLLNASISFACNIFSPLLIWYTCSCNLFVHFFWYLFDLCPSLHHRHTSSLRGILRKWLIVLKCVQRLEPNDSADTSAHKEFWSIFLLAVIKWLAFFSESWTRSHNLCCLIAQGCTLLVLLKRQIKGNCCSSMKYVYGYIYYSIIC